MDLRSKTVFISWNIGRLNSAIEELTAVARMICGKQAKNRNYENTLTNGQEESVSKSDLPKSERVVVLLQEVSPRQIRMLKSLGWAAAANDVKAKFNLASVVAVMPADVRIRDMYSDENLLTVALEVNNQELLVTSLYFRPRESIRQQLNSLCKVMELPGTKIFGGDFNARARYWGDTVENSRGKRVKDWIMREDLALLKTERPTFSVTRGGRLHESHVDFFLLSTEIQRKTMQPLNVLSMQSSDHSPLILAIDISIKVSLTRQTTRIYAKKQDSYEAFSNMVEEKVCSQQSANTSADTGPAELFTKKLHESADKTLRKSRLKISRGRQIWWDEELETQRKCVGLLRKRLNSGSTNAKANRRRLYEKRVIEYKAMIVGKKKQYWASQLSSTDVQSVWEKFYKRYSKEVISSTFYVTGADGCKIIDRQIIITMLGNRYFERDLLEGDLPVHTALRASTKVYHTTEASVVSICMGELLGAIAKSANNKVPGSDGVTNEMIKALGPNGLKSYLNMLNAFYENGEFPKEWKKAVIVFIEKVGAPAGTLKQYRPIGLLCCLGKIYERILYDRILEYRTQNLPKEIRKKQYGFMPEVSAEDALADLTDWLKLRHVKGQRVCMLSLDIESAFDRAWWPFILARLKKINVDQYTWLVLRDYMTNRSVELRLEEKKLVLSQEKGCVQGSVLGPLLWNLIVDELLENLHMMGVRAQAFADDIAIVSAGRTFLEASARLQSACLVVEKWASKAKLKLSVEKTVFMPFRSNKRSVTGSLTLQGKRVKEVWCIKLLGVIIDKNLTWVTHYTKVVEKIQRTAQKLFPLVKRHFGPGPECVRLIYEGVILPRITYAAATIEDGLQKETVIKLLNKAQRQWLIKAYRLYKTTSLRKCQLVTCTPDIKEVLRERSELHKVRRTGKWLIKPLTYTRVDVPRRRKLDQQLTIGQQETMNSNGVEKIVDVYTDGSKINNKVGAAYVIICEEEIVFTRCIKLADECSVYQAEMLAIVTLLREIDRAAAGWTNLRVYTDSKSAVETIYSQGKETELSHMLKSELRRARNNGKSVSIKWVRGHTGITGNEAADQAAKLAALGNNVVEYSLLPLSSVKRTLRAHSFERLEQALKTNCPDLLKHFGTSWWNKNIYNLSLGPEFCWLITGHGPLKSHLFRIGVTENTRCCCGVENQDYRHILHCPLLYPIWSCRGDIWGALVKGEHVLNFYIKNKVDVDSLCGKVVKELNRLNSVNDGGGN